MMESEQERTVLKRGRGCILLSEISQTKKAAYSMTPTICHSGKDKPMKTVKIPWRQGIYGAGLVGGLEKKDLGVC